jgi:hypothetical protein
VLNPVETAVREYVRFRVAEPRIRGVMAERSADPVNAAPLETAGTPDKAYKVNAYVFSPKP